MILGHGIDVVEHARFSRLMTQEEAFVRRCFTPVEIEIGKCTPNSLQWFASRFAAKESVMKALGTGWLQGVSWHDILITTSAEGAPSVVLTGKTAERAQFMGIASWLLSISHSENISIASVIALGKNDSR
jgi:holo-[acyl-carrier protein] synthase